MLQKNTACTIQILCDIYSVLMDIDEYERLLELAEFYHALNASLTQADRGEVISHEEARKESNRWLKKTTK